MTKEDKVKIAARLFYQDDNGYEDYRDAHIEFCSNCPSEEFINFATQDILKKEDGHKIFFNGEGHVATLRMSDGFFSPRTEMSEDEGEELEEKIMDEMDKIDLSFTEVEASVLALKNLGWVEAI
jgi:hypothetical protein